MPTPLAPVITGTIANQVEVDDGYLSGGSIAPFSAVSISDANSGNGDDSATITVTDANGNPTDQNGSLGGVQGLTKTGMGRYTLQAVPTATLADELEHLSFSLAYLSPGSPSRTTHFGLTVTSDANTSATDNTTSVIEKSPTYPPTITGVEPNPQAVVAGGSIKPFSTVGIGDANPVHEEGDTVTIVVTDAHGTPTDANGLFIIPNDGGGLSKTGVGTYTLSGTLSAVNGEFDNLVFNTASSQTATTTHFNLTVTTDLKTTATNNSTSIVATPDPPPPSTNNFQVVDETTGQSYQTSGTPYVGPVTGLTSEFITVTPDNMNINALTPNVFIHSGDGQDGLAALSGTNVLDGGTNSNFLTGGTGQDTFYMDDRSPSAPIFSTIVNFHSGDAATVFGVTQADFQFIVLPNEGAAGFTGVDLLYHANNGSQPDVSFVLAGYTAADLTNGKLSMVYSTELDGTPFMTLRAT